MKSTLSVQMWHLPLPLCAVTLNVTGLSYCHIVRTFKSPIAISEVIFTRANRFTLGEDVKNFDLDLKY